MDERCGYEDSCAEMPADEERVIRDGEAGKATDDDGKGAGEGAEGQDKEEGEDVEA